jgi:hypothetical protein
MKFKILAIATSLPGWVAKFSHENGSTTYKPVAFWAIVNDEGFLGHRVVGFSETDGTGFCPDDSHENFEGWTKIDYLKTGNND